VDKLVQTLNESVIEVLPAVRALSGCDTTSKFGTKHAALKHAKASPHLLARFGKDQLSEAMIYDAESYLAGIIKPNYSSMNDCRISQYHRMKRLDFSKLPPTSSATQLHIKRSYLQTYRWCHILDDSTTLNPSEYGFIEQHGEWLPCIIEEVIPEDFPHPCKCKKCARDAACKCRASMIPCSKFCDCKSEDCRNPFC
jgi:hypothetical protein